MVGKQWGITFEGEGLNLPILTNVNIVVGMHEGNTKQIVTYSNTQKTFIGTGENIAIWWIAVCSS